MADENQPDQESGNRLRAMAESLDANSGEPVSVETSETHAPDPEQGAVEQIETPESSSEITSETPEAKPGERQRDPKTGKFIKTEAEKQADEAKAEADKTAGIKPKPEAAPADKPESEFVKKQKERERLEKTWQNAEKRKSELEAKERELAERERRIASLPPAQAPRATKNGYTADEYESAAKEFIEAGEHESAVKALAAAREVRSFEAQHYQKMHAESVQKGFNADMEAVMKEYPDTANPEHPIAAEIQNILKANPWVQFVPQGFRKVAEIAQMRIEGKENARVISELQEENKTLKAELDKRDSEAQLSASGTPGGPRSKSLSEMSGDEARTSLRERAEELDSGLAA